ncbi:ATP-binding protein [Mangrovimonas sp. ST2L15]|uniref:ATP-binding response regulator n=1 Tax=Mangrovimonas sp. ST2L15 TaxID=1645916 RepID=UPI0006B482ED|nr:ATP-binding protein [Mangrovimonas sp. ST2L15]
MKLPQHRITLKVIIGYIILGILAVISGYLVLSEIKTFTQFQNQDISDRNKIIKTGGLIADIYENESLARAAIQLSSSEKFDVYVEENEALLKKIDSLNFMVDNDYQKFILDSIKVVFNKKLQNITDLKELKLNDNSDRSIEQAIKKLGSIESILGKITVEDFVENPNALDRKTKTNLQEYVDLINKYNPQDSINTISQKEIDSIVTISKSMLRDLQRDNTRQRASLLETERELIENDLTTSRKLRELLKALESDIILYSNNLNKKRAQTLNHSRQIIIIASVISFILIVIFSFIILNDFWKSQEYRKQLEAANKTTSSLLKSREQLISMVSHDLRTPLSTVTGYSELLQKNTTSVKEKNYLEHIRNASSYMGQLVEDLLEFSKLEDGKIAIESVPFNIRQNIDDIAQGAQNIYKNKPVELIVEHDKQISWPIVSDPFRIKQILYNLMVNAYKFTKTGSIKVRSTLESERSHDFLKISVSDTGIGISKDQQETIFKAFTQADSSEETKQNGFGLGLTISKKLAELLGGTLTLESDLGVGSTFTLRIPVTFSKQQIVLDTQAPLENQWNLTALIIEDDPSLRQLLNELLVQYGVKPHLYSNGQAALEQLHGLTYDFVLTDIQLPKMNGIQFMERLKQESTYSNQPIFAMTGRANLSVEDYKESGFSEVLIKPFHPNELQKLLTQYFKNRSFETKINTSSVESSEPEGFSVKSLGSFMNHDPEAIKNTLRLFSEDNEQNYLHLMQAFQNKNIEAINQVSHKMLSMYRQLEVEQVLPYLEKFETASTISEEEFDAFQDNMEVFLASLKLYLG